MFRTHDAKQTGVKPTMNQMSSTVPMRRLSKLYGLLEKASISISSLVLSLIGWISVGKKNDSNEQTDCSISMDDIPDDVLLMVIERCDAATCLALRAVNTRFYKLVSRAVRSRMPISGGVEMLGTSSFATELEDRTTLSGTDEYILLKRKQSGRSIEVPMGNFISLMKHISICHSFKMMHIEYDDIIEAAIAKTEFRCIADFVMDQVQSISAESLVWLVRKVAPSNILKIRFHPMSSWDSLNAVTAATINASRARTVTIETANSLVHNSIDDSTLVDIVLWEERCSRTVHLPMSAVTHDGIRIAALKFYEKCCAILGEMESAMLLPKSQFIITLPESPYIQRDLVTLHEDVVPFSKFVLFEKGGFILEVRVQLMVLRIIVQSTDMIM